MNIRTKIGSRIKELRELNNLTQIELSEKAGVHERTIRNIENGSFDVKIETINKIATALGCTLEIKAV